MGRPRTSSSDDFPRLSYDQRRSAIHYESDDGTLGEIAYPINYEELYNLKGRLLTLIDATFSDPQQRKAFKDVAWHTLKDWMEMIALDAGDPPGHLKAAMADHEQSAA